MSWRRFLRRTQWDAERRREIESYLEIETADNIARGLTPDAAASAARRKLGNPTLIREEIYRMNTVSWLESIAQDVRYGVRLLFASPVFAVVAIVSLALGIGANTAIFQLVDAVRLQSLPVRNPGELAEIKIAGGNHGMGLNSWYGELTRPIWEEIRRNHPAFSDIFAFSRDGGAVGQGSSREQVRVLTVSGGFFSTLAIGPWRGRLLSDADEQPCPGSSAVISYAYWQRKLGGREIDANTKLLIDGVLGQIVGVTPPWFSGPIVGESVDIILPSCRPKELARNSFEVTVIGRLRPGLNLSQASAGLAAMSPGIMAATEITGYDSGMVARYRQFRLAAYPAASGVSRLRDQYDSSLWLLLAITGLVLLIACANLANLMLSRAAAREREIAVRLALGAPRSRLLRQLLIESSMLAATGAVLGVALAEWLSRALVRSLSIEEEAVILHTAIDWRVLMFASAIAVLTCIVFGMAPAFRASGINPAAAIKTGGRGLTAGRERFSIERFMVVLQISVSLILLVGALLFVRSFHNLMTFNPGMREQGITIAFVAFGESHVPPERYNDFARDVLDEVRTMPGVLAAATSTHVPLIGGSWGHTVTIGGVEGPSRFTWASPGYFETMGIPVLIGRDFNQSDTATSQRVAVVNQAFVRRYLNGASPIGLTLRTHAEPDYPSTAYEIVGVIPDTKYDDLRGDIPPMTFAPASQFPAPRPWTAIMIHSNLPPQVAADTVKRFLGGRHPEMVVECRDFETNVHAGLVRERLMATLSGFFGLLAALLAMVGLYGVMSYVTARRRNEIGIRVALGANTGQVVGMVMREAAILLLAGVIIGAVLALLAARAAATLLFGLTPYDPPTLLTAIVLLASIGALASWLPARRASRLDPMAALRSE